MPKAKLEVGNTIRATGHSFGEHRALIFEATLIFALVNAASTLLNLAGGAGFALLLGFGVLSTAVYNGVITALICLPGKAKGLGEPWAAVRPMLARLIWLSLITAVMIGAGLFALIIPGLIIGTYVSVAGQSVIVERNGVTASIGRSLTLVSNSFWRVFGFLAIIILISTLLIGLSFLVALPLAGTMAGSLVANFLTSLLGSPLLAVGLAVLFRHLVELESGILPEAEVTDKARDEKESSPPEPLP